MYPHGEVDLFQRDLANVVYFERCCQHPSDRVQGGKFVFINAWNEWGEGMAIEPSNLIGDSFLKAIRDVARIFRKSKSRHICLDQDKQFKVNENAAFIDVWDFLKNKSTISGLHI